MRIGTWNLQGRWDQRHLTLLEHAACNAWLLTEVNVRVGLPGYDHVRTQGRMAAASAWAGVFARGEFRALPDPHPATAAALVDGVTAWSSILPWRSCGTAAPWEGARHVDKTRATIDGLKGHAPATELVWGGDWNHALSGREYTGSIGGRHAIEDAPSCDRVGKKSYSYRGGYGQTLSAVLRAKDRTATHSPVRGRGWT